MSERQIANTAGAAGLTICIMNQTEANRCIVGCLYEKEGEPMLRYIVSHVGDMETAYDLLHDTFLRLLSYTRPLVEAEIRKLAFTIARNLIADHHRRTACRERGRLAMTMATPVSVNDVEAPLNFKELAMMEMQRVKSLPPKRRQVYFLSRYRRQSTAQIAARYGLSKRTVEGHLSIARSEIRTYISKCI